MIYCLFQHLAQKKHAFLDSTRTYTIASSAPCGQMAVCRMIIFQITRSKQWWRNCHTSNIFPMSSYDNYVQKNFLRIRAPDAYNTNNLQNRIINFTYILHECLMATTFPPMVFSLHPLPEAPKPRGRRKITAITTWKTVYLSAIHGRSVSKRWETWGSRTRGLWK